jgi:alpha-galactosidase|eukprot:COSAG06_NODE_8099_length_2273_cov_3.421803_3_plen_53_part_00
MKALVAQIHSLGMKIGLYGAASGVTCGTMPGTLYHEDLDAQTYADWGIDYRE